MIAAEFGNYAVIAMGSFAAGALLGRKLALEAANALHALEQRLAAIEHRSSTPSASKAIVQEGTEAHALAVTKLASAIEKHAAAIDDHGAATVAAAVESNATPTATSEKK